jgi:CRP/FNR family transcriptional regulator
MTSGVRTEEQFQLKTAAPCSVCKTLGVPCAIEGHVTSVRTRRGQTLALQRDGGDTAFIIRAGVAILQVTFPGRKRQIVGLYFPGDLLRSSFAPPCAEAVLVAASSGEIWRIRVDALEALAAAEPAVRRYLDAAITSRIARQAIHAAMLGQFDCEQRVATLLIELALCSARPSPGAGVMFEMPFSRKDIADYLGLNPDTLSRIMSRLKNANLIGHSERSRMTVRNLAALAACSPAAQSLIEIGAARGQERPLGTIV